MSSRDPEYMRRYYQANRNKWKQTPEQQEARNARRRERYRQDAAYREAEKVKSRGTKREQKRAYALKTAYGLTLEGFTLLLQSQGGKCAICGQSPTGKRKDAFHVDHCHKTGIVRGILCPACNHGIGKFKDDPKLLRKAASYLEGDGEPWF